MQLPLSSEEAEDLLFNLAVRFVIQRGQRSPDGMDKTRNIAVRLEQLAIDSGAWDPNPPGRETRFEHHVRWMKSVKITHYELPPGVHEEDLDAVLHNRDHS